MIAAAPANSAPPEAELQFDVGSTDDSLERMIELFGRHGDTYRVFVPSRRSYTYVIHHPDDVKRVLVSNHRNYTKGLGLDRVKILLGKGIMTSEGELWRRQRYMMQPLFHRRVITEFAAVIAQANDRCIARWEGLARAGELINLTDEMSELTLEIVLRSIFGRDLDRLSQQLGGNPFEVVTREQSRDLQFAYKFRSLTKLVAQLITQRRAGAEDHFDYIAMLMNARDKETGAPMGERELIDEIMTLIVAGHETTASGLNWTWYLLSQHPQVEARLHAEIDAAADLPAPTLTEVETLGYTRCVVDEALRLYPPGWLLSRRTIEADVLGGYPVPAGTNVLLPLYLLHRHPHFWKNPEAFEPERFAPEHEAERPRFAYMPFAAGPRHCIGETFALYEMLVHLYKVARRYRLRYVPDKPLELEAQINLRTRYPLHMRLEAPVIDKVTTLTELIENNRSITRNLTYLEGENDTREVSFAELYARALGILYHLQRIGARRGDKLILFLGNNEQFIDVFWAAILGGIVPVPVALGISDEHRHKLLRIARRLGTPFLYTERRSLERIGAFAAQAGEQELFDGLRRRTFLVDDLDDISRAGSLQRVGADDIAFIQFSSGSTSEPKGVVLTHRNILANIRGATEAAAFSENDVSLSWMPLTHDMGLIGFHLVMFANRIHAHLMPTELFIRRPLLWLTFAARVRATILCSPNFGYKHYLKVLGDREVAGLDLSAVRFIFNGAEPISVELCNEFLTRLAPARLAPSAMFPVYGLAEASLAVSFPEPGAPLRTLALNRHQMNAGSAVQPVSAADRDAVQLVSEGRPIPYCRVRIADDDDRLLPADRIGHVHITGENVTRGYYEDPTANAAAFSADGWLRTGDLGLFHGGELYISGRAKEIIFVNGQNYYPHDLEAIAQRGSGLELGKVVAAGVRRRGAEVEQLVVFVLHRGALEEFLPLARQVSRLINEQTGLEVAEVVPVKRIPKTTSGKIQRHLLEESYAEGEFDPELRELAALRAAQQGPEVGSRTAIEDKLKNICDAALEGKRVDIHDNLFEIGASSLKLIEIHEQIDREYPGKVDLTELFDFPTIAELAQHLQSKLA